jgi:hypothetical protein
MPPVMDAAWRAVLYCLHPRVIALSFAPLVLLLVLGGVATYFGWDPANDAVRAWIDSSGRFNDLLQWLSGMGMGNLKTALVPLLVLAVAVPILVMLCLIAVSVLMTPAIVSLVAERRFADLQRKKGAGLATQVVWSLGSAVVAVLVFVVTLPLWLVPMVVLLLPPLIWGWLSYRVLSFDALADHCDADERRLIMKEHRSKLMLMGVVTGYLGTAPSVLGASGALTIAFAPIFLPLALWLYTLVFAFSSAWFAHYCLNELHRLRSKASAAVAEPVLDPVDAPDAGAPPPLLPLS